MFTQAMRRVRRRVRHPPAGIYKRIHCSSTAASDDQDSLPRDTKAPAGPIACRNHASGMAQPATGPDAPPSQGKSAAEYSAYHAESTDTLASQ